jgi:DNA-binding beta-propeller fold protein YncE
VLRLEGRNHETSRVPRVDFRHGGNVSTALFAQQAKPPELTVRANTEFLKLPDDVYFGEAVGVSIDSKGNIYVANRGKHPLMEFRPDGTFLRFIGEGLDVYEAPHSVFIDPQDNIWYVDAGTNLIIKMDQQTRLQMVLGKKPEAWTWETHVVEHGAPGPTFFYQPTGVAFAPDGSLFISDGYGNSRVAHFGADGHFIKDWGRRGPDPGQFNTPHTLVVDQKGIVYVGDRGNRRVQVFDAEGNLLKVWTNTGAPWSMCITPGPNQMIWIADGAAGRFVKFDLSGNALGAFGKEGKMAGQFGWTHGVACPNENTLYAAEELNFRVQKLEVQPSR